MTATPETTPDPLDGAFSASWLTAQYFPPVEYVVPGLIPEGLTMLVAPPKIGKSWMVLGLAKAAAEGSRAFGAIHVQQRPVLYLALEDGPRRLQDRLHSIGVTDGTPDLMFMTDVPLGAVTTIRTYVERFADRNPLVILDTLGKVRDVYAGNDAYQKDYGQMSLLKDIVDDHPGSSLLIVHHTNKGERTDFVASVSGTQGLAGAADSILSIQRDRNSGDATLNVTSRDAAEGQYAVQMSERGAWSLDGPGLIEAATAAEQRRAVSGVGDKMTDIIEAVNAHPDGITPTEVEQVTGLPRNTVDVYLKRAADEERIIRKKRGLYIPVRSVSLSDTGPEVPGQSDVLTHLTPLQGPCRVCGEPMHPATADDGAHPMCA